VCEVLPEELEVWEVLPEGLEVWEVLPESLWHPGQVVVLESD
jgi:hypothetical protein